MGRQVIGRRSVLLAAAAAVLIGGIAAVHAPREVAPERTQAGGRKKAGDMVKVQATAAPADANHKVTVTVTITIAEGWHIYANQQPAGSSTVPTTVSLTGGDKPQAAQVAYPGGREVRDEQGSYRIYEGRVRITAVLDSLPPATPLHASVHFQTCKGDTCLLPATVKVPVQ